MSCWSSKTSSAGRSVCLWTLTTLIVTALLFQSLDTQDQPVQNIGALAARLDQVGGPLLVFRNLFADGTVKRLLTRMVGVSAAVAGMVRVVARIAAVSAAVMRFFVLVICINADAILSLCLASSTTNMLLASRGTRSGRLNWVCCSNFVPKTYMEKVDIFEDFITLLGNLNRNNTPLMVNSFYIIDDETSARRQHSRTSTASSIIRLSQRNI